jgi:ferritin-like metal-binding protein YciE
MAAKTLENLFHEILKEVYYAEKRLLRAMPKMAKGARSRVLAAAFERYGAQAQGQIQRLETIFEMLGKRPEDRTWPVIGGMIDEGLDFLQHYKTSPALDAGLLAAAQAVGQCQSVRYATLKRWAAVLGMQGAAKLLDESVQAESRNSRRLNTLADSVLQAETAEETLNFDAVQPAASFSEAA